MIAGGLATRICIVALLFCGLSSGPAVAQRAIIKIVGVGATPCRLFLKEAATGSQSQRDYLAWAQGYMSGLVSGSASPRYDRVDLSSDRVSLVRQLEYLRRECEGNPDQSFADVVEALFRFLSAERENGRPK